LILLKLDILKLMLFNILFYAAFCGFSVLVGLGILRILRLNDVQNKELISPIITLAFWTVLLGITVILGVPIRQSSIYIWMLSSLLALLGLAQVKGLASSLKKIGSLLFCLLLPIGLMVAYFWRGRLFSYLGSSMPDSWLYIAAGQYLWTFVRGTNGGSAPLYQFAVLFNHSRFISSAFLAHFSILIRPGDTQSTMGLLQAWALFVFAASVTFFSIRAFPKKVTALFFTFAVIFSGWTFNLMWQNNFDQLVTIGYLPTLAVLVKTFEPKRMAWTAIFGLLIAGFLYGYPEMAIFVLWGLFILYGARLIRQRKEYKSLALAGLSTLLIAGILFWPFYKEFVNFLMTQLSTTGNAVRLGEGIFGPLTLMSAEPGAFWGLGGELGMHPNYLFVQNFVGLALSVFALLGIAYLVKKRNVLALVWLSTIIGALYLIISRHYSYGAYKLIMFSWWGLVYFVFIGLETVKGWFGKLRIGNYFVVFVGSGLIAAAVISTSYHIYVRGKIEAGNQIRTIERFKQLEGIKKIVGKSTVATIVDYWLANEWAVYYLRDLDVDLLAVRAYMVNSMNRTKAYSNPIAYILTDRDTQKIEMLNPNFKGSFRPVWSSEIYRLWRVKSNDWFILADIKSDGVFFSELEIGNNSVFLWLGKVTRLKFASSRARNINLTLTATPGPGFDNPRRVIEIAGYPQYQNVSFSESKRLKIPLKLKKGQSEIVIKSVYPSKATKFLPGDNRELLVKLSNIKIAGE